ncbi:MAG: VWA-like domain-containing protein [Thermoproteus sp. AZ2]|uniref:VWA-like domain-containing protein n=1 Tax=Thermoproteus sp. AZ2 TaxID=1609232 RepID=A0ACC6UZD0_9CREN
MELEELLEEFQRIKDHLMLRDPTYYYLVMSFPIAYSKEVPKNAYAMFTGNTILVGDRFLSNSLTTENRAAILMHEVLHAYLGHLERAKDLMKMGKAEEAMAFNVAADVVINEKLEAAGFEVPWDMLRASHVGVSRAMALKMSAEELAARLSGLSRRHLLKLYRQSSKLAEGERQAQNYVMINKGSEEVRRAKDAGDLRRALERGLRRLQTYKEAGTSPHGHIRPIGDFDKPTIDWRRVLRLELEEAVESVRDIRKRWSRSSRKSEWYPSKIGLGNDAPEVYVLIDTSASIDDEKLRRFASEIYGVIKAGLSKVVVIPWDARAYEPLELRRPGDIEKIKRSLRGGGGTIPDEAIKYVLANARRRAVVIVLSDFELAETGETKKLFQELAERHKVILVSAGKSSVEYPGVFIHLKE